MVVEYCDKSSCSESAGDGGVARCTCKRMFENMLFTSKNSLLKGRDIPKELRIRFELVPFSLEERSIIQRPFTQALFPCLAPRTAPTRRGKHKNEEEIQPCKIMRVMRSGAPPKSHCNPQALPMVAGLSPRQQVFSLRVS